MKIQNKKKLQRLIRAFLNAIDNEILDFLEPDEQGIKQEIKIHAIKKILDKYYLPD